MQISGIILAGGKSNRMGMNKALLELGGLTLIEKVVRVMSGACSEIIISGGNPANLEHLGYPVVPDTYPERGPLSGIHAGLVAARNRYSFVSACDTPFLDERLIRKIVSEACGYEAVILKHGEYYEPLSSLYSKAFISAAETSIKNGVFKVTAALSLVRWKTMNVEPAEMPGLEKSLFNINTPRDYEKAKKFRKL